MPELVQVGQEFVQLLVRLEDLGERRGTLGIRNLIAWSRIYRRGWGRRPLAAPYATVPQREGNWHGHPADRRPVA